MEKRCTRLRWLRRVGPLTPVVVLAQPEDNQQMMEAVRLGAEDYVLKPLQADGLERVLRRHMLSREVHALDLRAEDVEAIGDNFFFVAAGPVARRLRARASLLAQVTVPVLITGESGSGRETAARLIHKLSIRAEFPFAKINCSMLSPEVLERELWSQDPGAGAGSNRATLDLGRKGTVLLDEVDSLPDPLQTKLLTLFQSKQVFRNGGDACSARGCSRDGIYLSGCGGARRYWPSTRRPVALAEHIRSSSAEPSRTSRRNTGVAASLHESFGEAIWPSCSPNLFGSFGCVPAIFVAGEFPRDGEFREALPDRCGDESVAKSEVQGGPVLASVPVSHRHEPKPHEIAVVHNGGNGDKQGLKSLLRSVKSEAERNAIARALKETQWNRKAAARLLSISYRALLYKIQQYQMTPRETHSASFVNDGRTKETSH